MNPVVASMYKEYLFACSNCHEVRRITANNIMLKARASAIIMLYLVCLVNSARFEFLQKLHAPTLLGAGHSIYVLLVQVITWVAMLLILNIIAITD